MTGLKKIERLSKSNADAERIFSKVVINKTSTRNSLSLDGKLAFIRTSKISRPEPNCFKWEPIPDMPTESYNATNTYNKT